MASLLEVYVALTARKMMLVLWATYIPYSKALMPLHLILPHVTLGKSLIILMALLVLHSKYKRKRVLLYVLVI
jgi:hypothetical protein